MSGYKREDLECNSSGKELMITVSGRRIVGKVTQGSGEEPFYCLSITTPTGAVVPVDVLNISHVEPKK